MGLPDLESLRCFEAAAVHLNFRAAAAKVHLSPPAFSDRIKRLEELLGVRLFERTTRRVRLTEAGQRLLGQARKTLREAEACRIVARDDSSPAPYELRIGTRYELGLSWILPIVSELEPDYPHRRIHLYFGDSNDLLGRVRRGEIDAAVTSVRLTDGGLAHERLHEEHYVFCAHPELAAAAQMRGPDDAPEHTLIDIHSDLPLFRYFLDARPASEVWSWGRVEQMGTIAACRYRLLRKAGVGVMPLYFVAPDLERGDLVRLLPDAPSRTDFFRLIWLEGHPLSRALQNLAGELRKRPLR